MADDVHTGLSAENKHIPPKYFYDGVGSQLFDRICELPEYYPTRTEIALLSQHKADFAELIGKNTVLFELGSGSSTKIRLLLDAVRPRAYVPIDISKDHLLEAAGDIAAAFPWLDVYAICADLTQDWEMPFPEPSQKKLAFYPGSSIGNFTPEEATELLKRTARLVGPGGGFLIGVDLKKDPKILNAAYNDSKGITAAFNKNVLVRINQELGADFQLDTFEHSAFYCEQSGRIEMHLVSTLSQAVTVNGVRYMFEKGESIHTENSYKYHIDEFQSLVKASGFQPERVWTDSQDLFSIHFLRAA